jgi:UDP-N-acetylglucosamine 2-epimerase (non-hydrolysing)
MRSGDKNMLEEINRTVCDHCSDYLFTYHKNYKKKLLKENIKKESIFIVGNTIVEVCSEITKKLKKQEKTNAHILMDIHRPENFKFEGRLKWIFEYANLCSNKYNLPVKMLNFKRTFENIQKFNLSLGKVELINLMNFTDYLTFVYNSKFIISDSGTGQEEPALLNTKVIVPRDFTERPESVENNCSFMLKENSFEESFKWLESDNKIQTEWMGDGTTSKKIISILKKIK